MDPVRLLIIEEHPTVRSALVTRLNSTTEVTVLAAVASIKEGIDLVCEYQPDVVLLGLTRNSNRDLIATIRQVASLTKCGTAVIVLTSYADDAERELFMDTGTYRYLIKDINSSHLIAEIAAVAAETSA